MELLAKLGINWQLMLAQIVNFLIVMGVLSMFVYRPLLDLIDRRTERIRKSMEDAKRLEEETRALETVRRERLKKIDEECATILVAARAKAEVLHAQMLEKAHAEAQGVLHKGCEDLQRERAEALREIESKLGRVILTLTEKLLEREFNEKDQQMALRALSDSIPALLR